MHWSIGKLHLQTRGSRWYLWPGLCVFDARWLGGRQLDLMPGRGFDVGGRLYDLWRTSLSLESLEWPALSYGRLREAGGVPQNGDIPQDDLYEVLGDWLHTINGSGWMPVKSRDQPVADLLRQF